MDVHPARGDHTLETVAHPEPRIDWEPTFGGWCVVIEGGLLRIFPFRSLQAALVFAARRGARPSITEPEPLAGASA